MSKIELNSVESGFLSNTAMNENFEAIQDFLNDNVLCRDNPEGEPNQMEQDLDMNGFRILNVLASSGEGLTYEGQWTPDEVYQINNIVYVASGTYTGWSMICRVTHTAGADFDTDYATSKWLPLASRGASGAGSGDMLKTDNLSGLANTTTARSNISAAKSGANSDITSFTQGITFDSTISVTGNATFAGNVTLGNAVTDTTTITGELSVDSSVGTDGQILSSQGVDLPPTWIDLPSSGFTNMQVFTNSGTFTVPAGVTKVKVTVVGGGGNGAVYGGTIGYGGAGGGLAIKICDVTPSDAISVTVASSGGTSSFGSYCSATGGANGGNGTVAGPIPGIGVDGDINASGSSTERPSNTASSSKGGDSFFCGGAQPFYNATGTSKNGTLGGGGSSGNAGSSAGGTGGAGIVIVEY